MPGSSLARRLFFLAALWSAASLVLAGFVLVTVYRGSVERAFDERLSVHLKTLIGALAAQPDRAFRSPDGLGEARFELPLSGWYWVVRRGTDDRVVVASRSLTGETLPLPSDSGRGRDADNAVRAYVAGPDGQRLRVVERAIDFDGEEVYRIAVAGNAGELAADIEAVTWRIVGILALVGLALVGSTAFQVRIALAPLDRIRAALARIRAGEAERLEGEVPQEIAPLAQELNDLIEANRETMERARGHVGNLAHAIKTPLSVILNEARAADGPLAERVTEQAGLIRDHVEHHLERARMAAQRRVIGVVTDVAPVAGRVVRAMHRIHQDKDLLIESDVAPDLHFRGEREDLEEALGNLLDNACKWATSRVALTAAPVEADPAASRRFLLLTIDDDGPGLGEAERIEALRRGRRLDERVPGTGLGLAIVAELAALYLGELTLDTSPFGGLRCRLRLPAL